jgi:hypothetical protein
MTDGEHVTVALNDAQISQIVRTASNSAHIGHRLASLKEHALPASESLGLDNPRLSRSLLQGLLIYASLPTDGGSVGVVEMAQRLDLTASTTHRYLVTLVAIGLASQDPRSRRYSRAA